MAAERFIIKLKSAFQFALQNSSATLTLISVAAGAAAGACAYLRYSNAISTSSTSSDCITTPSESDVTGEISSLQEPVISGKIDYNHLRKEAETTPERPTQVYQTVRNNDATLPPKLEHRLFSSPTTVIKDAQRVRKIIHDLIADGDEKLQVITDFDYTISRYTTSDGNRCDTTYQIVERSLDMPVEYREETAKLRKKYLPMQQDLTVPEQDREDAMQNWLTQSHKLMKDYKLCEESLFTMVNKSNMVLRRKFPLFLKIMGLNKVPVTIFSAGLAPVIREILRSQVGLSDNISVVANELLFNPDGTVAGVKQPLVHGLNKELIVASRVEYFEKHRNRHNVILVGDSIGDAHMAAALPGQTANVLKIGFLVQDFENIIDVYKDLFDIVVVDQESFAVVNDIANYIFSSNKQALVAAVEPETHYIQRSKQNVII